MKAGHEASSPILSARNLQLQSAGQSAAMSLDLILEAEDLVLVVSPDRQRNGKIIDHLLGLHEPLQPDVSFLGQRWIEQTSEQAFLLRRTIGRVQHRGNWMESRSVMDNILLPAMHNSVVDEEELRRDAGALAQHFGLPGLPTLPPALCPPPDLRRAACVRAFFGRPVLVILEHPLDAEDSELLSPMMSAIQQVRRRQGAVLWFTEHLALAVDPSIPASRRFQVVGTKLVELQP